MRLSEYLNCLLNDGRVRVSRPTGISEGELREADELLLTFEREYRRELPAVPPTVCLPAARWAAAMLYRASQFITYRDTGETTVAEMLAGVCPADDPLSVHYSVDLTFRFLPDLGKLARCVSPRDPLLAHIAKWAVEWPLSSVGMANVGPVRIDPWAEDSCLLGLYVDRVIARGDQSRLGDRRVREAVQRAVGPFPDLAPRMAAAIGDETISPDLVGEDVP